MKLGFYKIFNFFSFSLEQKSPPHRSLFNHRLRSGEDSRPVDEDIEAEKVDVFCRDDGETGIRSHPKDREVLRRVGPKMKSLPPIGPLFFILLSP